MQGIRRVAAATLAVAPLLVATPVHADPPDPGELAGQARTLGSTTVRVVFGRVASTTKVNIAHCRRTLASAQADNPASSLKAYQVKVPLLRIAAVDHLAIDGTIYYDEIDSVSARVPDYCPAGVQTIVAIDDWLPGSEYYSGPAPEGDPGRSASSPLTWRVPYFGVHGNRPAALVTVHAEAWISQIGTYFCHDYHYQIVAEPEGPVIQRQDDAVQGAIGLANSDECVATG
jgi:hypothetical protein